MYLAYRVYLNYDTGDILNLLGLKLQVVEVRRNQPVTNSQISLNGKDEFLNFALTVDGQIIDKSNIAVKSEKFDMMWYVIS